MFFELFSFLVGFVLLLLGGVIFFKQKNDKKLNVFFIAIIGIAGFQRFFYGLDHFRFINIDHNALDINLKLTFFLPPLYFVFFWILFQNSLSPKKLFIIIGGAVVIVLSLYFFEFSRHTKQIVFFIYSSIYFLLIVVLCRSYLFNKKSLYPIRHTKQIKPWAFIMLGMFVLFFLFSNYTFSNYLYDSSKVLLQQFLTNTSILWFLIALYVLLNPLILYGEQLLQKELTTLDFEEITVWSKKKWPTSAADRTVEQKIAPHVNTFLLKLKNYENQLSQDFTKAPTLKELCFYLNYPQSHIKYIFKYYSFYSFSEYINVLKVRYAITLIKSDYLSNHTIDSLSKKALFTNRSTFFKNFKSFTGYSPSEYILKVRN